MKVTKCDQCKKEIKEGVPLSFTVASDIGEWSLVLTGDKEPEICKPCRNRIIRKTIKENFPLKK